LALQFFFPLDPLQHRQNLFQRRGAASHLSQQGNRMFRR
jgi:hypothetical protein